MIIGFITAFKLNAADKNVENSLQAIEFSLIVEPIYFDGFQLGLNIGKSFFEDHIFAIQYTPRFSKYDNERWHKRNSHYVSVQDKYFISTSFYFDFGLGYEQVIYEDIFFSNEKNEDQFYKAIPYEGKYNSIRYNFAVGNRWNVGPMFIGVNWLCYEKGIVTSSTLVKINSDEAISESDRQNAQEKAKNREADIVIASRFYIGW